MKFKLGDFVMDHEGDIATIASINKDSFFYKWRIIRGQDVGENGVTACCDNSLSHLFTKIAPAVFDILKGIK